MQDIKPKLKIESKQVNSDRRKFLKFLSLGGGAFILGFLTRSFGPLSKLFSKSSFEISPDELKNQSNSATQKETDYKNFKVIEKKESMVFIDKKANEEILILDWKRVDTDEDK